MTYWFTSDLHLGHEKVAELRGFPNVRKHDTVIIGNLLRSLNSGDKLFVLGDVSLGRKVDVSHAVNMLRPVANLVGYRNMSLVRGNHDPVSQWATQQFASVFSTITDRLYMPVPDTYCFGVTMSHYPSARMVEAVKVCGAPEGVSTNAFDEKVLHGVTVDTDADDIHLYGHTHDKSPTYDFCPRNINIGVDAWGMKPVNAETIMSVL